MKSKAWKNWLFCSVLFCSVLFCSVGLINFIVDPLWIFGNNGWGNGYRMRFNDRQQKTNYLPQVINEIEGILIGSSMSMTINTMDFYGLKFATITFHKSKPINTVNLLPFSETAWRMNSAARSG